MRAALTPADAAPLPDWLPDAMRRALTDDDTDPVTAVLAAARLLRTSEADGRLGALKAFLAEAARDEGALLVAEAARVALARAAAGLEALESGGGTGAFETIAARDDAESLLWALGLGESGAERPLVEEAAALDAHAQGLSSELARALWHEPGGDERAWLVPIARSSERAWWLDPLVLARHRDAVTGWLNRPLVGDAMRALALPRRVAGAKVAFQYGGAAETEVERILERPLGAPVARMFDGAVLVHAHGLADHDAESPPGLVIRTADGDLSRLGEVRLSPPGPAAPHRSDVALAVWVPLAGAADAARTLEVSYRESGGDEHIEALRLDPPADAPD